MVYTSGMSYLISVGEVIALFQLPGYEANIRSAQSYFPDCKVKAPKEKGCNLII